MMLKYYPVLAEAALAFQVYSRQLLFTYGEKQNLKKKRKKKPIDLTLYEYIYDRDAICVAHGYQVERVDENLFYVVKEN